MSLVGNPLTLNCEVPQHIAVFKALFCLFCRYINSLCNLEIGGKMITYVDKICWIFDDDSWENIFNSLASYETV